jgi:hypothetical protein
MCVTKVIFGGMLGLCGALVGCAVNPDTPQPLPPIVVPQGATLLAYGSSLPPLFYTPRTSETLYIYDESEQQVVAVTRTPETPADISEAPIDLNRLGITLNPDHRYRVYGSSGITPVPPPAVIAPAMPPAVLPADTRPYR